MDERQWLASESLAQMIDCLRAGFNAHRTKAGRRKLRLYCCACARRLWGQLNDRCRDLVEGIEQSLDDRLSKEEVQSRYAALVVHYHANVRAGDATPYGVVWSTASPHCLDDMAKSAASSVAAAMVRQVRAGRKASNSAEEIDAAVRECQAQERLRQAELLRELFGNPFRVPPKRKWPADVRGLAQACYEDHAHYPMLADALDDLGEEEAAAHCRLPDHVRGCHVVDWVLGR